MGLIEELHRLGEALADTRNWRDLSRCRTRSSLAAPILLGLAEASLRTPPPLLVVPPPMFVGPPRLVPEHMGWRLVVIHAWWPEHMGR